MRRLLSVMLALILTLSVGMRAANAKLTERGYEILLNHVAELEDDDVTLDFYIESGCEKYIDMNSPLFRRFMEWGNDKSGSYYGGVSRFRELYTQRDEDGTIRWSILEANVGWPPPWEVKCGGIVADRFVYSIGGYDLFVSGWALYDGDKDDFVELTSVNAEDYPGLYEAIRTLDLGNPVGDADLDGEVTVIDATRIQRYLVKLDDLEKIGNAAYGACESLFADADGDGKITVLDAAAIQRVLVGLPPTEG